MSLAELLSAAWRWLVAGQQQVFLACLLIPVAGTAATWLGKRAARERTGHVVAGFIIAIGAAVLVLEVLAVVLARLVFDASVADAPVLLLLGPVLCALGALAGIHWVFPLNQLAAWRSIVDVGWFVLACAAALWLMSRFRGWGILFGGSLVELVVIAIAAGWLVRRLYRRAFRRA